MKKIAALLLISALLLCALSACGRKEAPVAGGWTANSEFGAVTLPEEAQAAFDKAMVSYEGDKLTPVAFLGTQVVAGINYQFLCQGKDGLVKATVYQDLGQNAEVTNTEAVPVSGPSEDAAGVEFEVLAGGWFCGEAVGGALGKDAQAAFDKAMEGFSGVGYAPLCVLGTQVVAGTNYAILAKATTVTAEPVSALAVVYVYADLSGGAEILGIEAF